jgi:hypothetical protein
MKFKKPILSIVHEIIGWMALAFAGLMLAGGAVGAINKTVAAGSQIMGASVAIAAAFVLAGLLSFGVAQIITAICETAFNTRRGKDNKQ